MEEWSLANKLLTIDDINQHWHYYKPRLIRSDSPEARWEDQPANLSRKRNYRYIEAEKTLLLDAAIFPPEALDHKQLRAWQQENQDILHSDEHNSKYASNSFFVEDENASYNKPALHDTPAWQSNFENNNRPVI